MRENILVIGSNSFSGSHFVDLLLSNSHTVVGVSRSHEPLDFFLPYKLNPNLRKFQFKQLDLNHDIGGIIDLVNEFQPEYVVNFAAQSMVAESWQYPEHWFKTNVVSNVLLHDHLRKVKFLKKYVHVSTPEVYGSTEGCIEETARLNPSTPYAVSRAACDMSLLSFFKNYDFPVVFTRAANVYGPGQQLYRIIPRTMAFIRLGKKLQLHGGGHSNRSFIHIRDVAAATYKVTTSAPPGESYHISTERQIKIRNLVHLICEKMGSRFEEVVELVDDRPGKDSLYWLDSSKIQSSLGWKDTISLENGLAETLSWVDRNIDLIRTISLDYHHKP